VISPAVPSPEDTVEPDPAADLVRSGALCVDCAYSATRKCSGECMGQPALPTPPAVRTGEDDGRSRGEGPCMDCGTLDTPVWSAPNDLWNRVVGSPDGYLCPWCFTVRAERVIGPVVWDLRPRVASNGDMVAALDELADSLDVDSCDPMPDATSRMLLAIAQRIRAVARG